MDHEKNEIVYSVYVQVNENDMIKFEPMPPEEVPEQDAKIEVDFDKFYRIILISEKDMRSSRIESPPWSKKSEVTQQIKGVVNGVNMWNQMRSFINSAEADPKESKKEMKFLVREFFSLMDDGGEKSQPPEGFDEENFDEEFEDEDVWESKGKITGEIIS